MQVRAGGEAGHADVADDLALRHACAVRAPFAKRDRWPYTRDDAVGVRQLDHVAVAALRPANRTRPSPAARIGVPVGAA